MCVIPAIRNVIKGGNMARTLPDGQRKRIPLEVSLSGDNLMYYVRKIAEKKKISPDDVTTEDVRIEAREHVARLMSSAIQFDLAVERARRESIAAQSV